MNDDGYDVIDSAQLVEEFNGMREKYNALLAGVRRHRDERGDDRCWMDDEVLYRLLPEGYDPPARDTSVEIQNCERFILCRRNPETEYVSPQRRIEELEQQALLLGAQYQVLMDVVNDTPQHIRDVISRKVAEVARALEARHG